MKKTVMRRRLGTYYIAPLRKELKIPDDLSIIIGIALGYADAEHPQNKFRSPRRAVQEAVTFKGI